MSNLLRLEISWTDPPGEDREAGVALAWGDGLLSVGDVPVWFAGKADAPRPVAWSWIELLEFLGSRWLHLTTEQTYPLGLTLADPRDLRSQASAVYASRFFDDSLPDDVDEELFRFEGRHDLSRALRGLTLPTVFLLREGDTVRVSADAADLVAPRRELFSELERVGDQIAARLATAKGDRPKAAVNAWQRRGTPDPRLLVSIASANAKVGTATLDYWELVNEPGADSELAAAARFMAGARPTPADFHAILTTIKQRPRVECAKLDELAKALKAVLDDARQRDAYEQGYALALAVRRELQVADDKAVDVEAIVRSFGVEIIEQTLSPGIDAVGCWGVRHGPAIIVNAGGRRSGKAHVSSYSTLTCRANQRSKCPSR